MTVIACVCREPCNETPSTFAPCAQWSHGNVTSIVLYTDSLFLRGWFRRRRCRRFRRWCLGGIGRFSWRFALAADKIEQMVFRLLALFRSQPKYSYFTLSTSFSLTHLLGISLSIPSSSELCSESRQFSSLILLDIQ